MSTRISNFLLLALAGCGGVTTDAAEDERVLCARGDAELARTCTVERERRDEGLVLTVRRPDGGFRRLLVTRDGRGAVAADGAEPARVTIVDPRTIEVALGNDRYLLPATVGSAKAAR